MPGASDIRAGKAFVELMLKDGLTEGLRNAKEKLRDFGKGMAAIGATVAAGALAVKGFMAAAVISFAESSDQLDKMSLRTGISTSALSMLGYAAKQSGQDLDTVETSVKKMQKSIGEAEQGSNEAIVALARLGLTAESLKAMSPDKQFELIGDSIAKIADPAMRATIAMQIFGKSGTALMPLMGHIGELRKEAEELHIPLSESDVKLGAKLSEAFTRLKAVFGSVVNAIGSALAPAMINLIGRGTNLLKMIGDWIRAHKELVVTVGAIATGVVAAGAALTGLSIAATLCGAAFGVVGTAISIVAGLIGALLSPIGLIVAALAGATAAWMNFTAQGQSTAAGIKSVLNNIKAVFSETFGGIVDAISAGEWALAGRIAIAGLKLALLEGWDAIKSAALTVWPTIQNAWTDSLNAICDVAQAVWLEIENIWTAAQTSIGTAALQFFGNLGVWFHSALIGIKEIWNTVWTGIENFFANVIAGLLDSLAKFVGAIPGAHEALVAFMGQDERDWSTIGDNMRKGIADRNKALADSKNQDSKSIDANKNEVNNAVGILQKRDADLKKQREDDYNKSVADRHNATRAKAPDIQEDPEIAKQKAELDALTKQAKDAHDKLKAKQKQREDEFKASTGAGAGSDGVTGLLKKDTFGSFSAAALVAGGGSTNHAAETAKNTASIYNHLVAQGKLVLHKVGDITAKLNMGT